MQSKNLLKCLLALAPFLLVFQNQAFADPFTLPSSDEATSCEEIDTHHISFRCGSYHLGPGWGEVNGVGEVIQKAGVEFYFDYFIGATSVNSATLQFLASEFSPYASLSGDAVLEIHGYAGNGVVEFTDLSADNLLLTTDRVTNGVIKLYKYDVTDFVNQLLYDGCEYAGFVVRDIAYGSHVSFSGSNTLLIDGNPVPEPATMLLLGSGLVGLAGFKRDIKSHN